MFRQPQTPGRHHRATRPGRWQAARRTLVLAPVLALLATVGAAQPQTVAEYYRPVEDLATSAVTLRSALHDLIDDHVRLPYTSSARDTWDMLKLADQDADDATRIVDVYQNVHHHQSVPVPVEQLGAVRSPHPSAWPRRRRVSRRSALGS